MMPLLISCIRLLFTVGMSLCVIGVLGCWQMTRFILTAGLNLTWWLRDPGLTIDGSGVISDPDRIDEQFRKAWLTFFCRAGRGAVDLSAFDREVGGWLPRLGEIDLPPLLWSDLYCVVQYLQALACGLDGLEWRYLKVFPESWFDWLAVVLSRVEVDGIWPEGPLDA